MTLLFLSMLLCLVPNMVGGSSSISLSQDKIFFEIDQNRDGYLELQDLFETCHLWMKGCSPSKVYTLFHSADEDRDGKISIAEFQHVMQSPQLLPIAIENLSPQMARLAKSFESLDVNNDGRISSHEVSVLFQWFSTSRSRREIRRILFVCDRNSDEEWDLQEYLYCFGSDIPMK